MYVGFGGVSPAPVHWTILAHYSIYTYVCTLYNWALGCPIVSILIQGGLDPRIIFVVILVVGFGGWACR